MPIETLCAGVVTADHLCAPIERIPNAGELVLSDELTLSIGGNASNAGTVLARLGIQVGVVACVGEDPLGRFVMETLEREGIDVTGIVQMPNVGTAATLVVNVKGQDRRFIHAPGANDLFSTSHIAPELVAKSRLFYLGGYLLLSNVQQEGLCEMFRLAREAGVTTMLDVVLPPTGDHWGRLNEVLAYTDVFLPNTDEAAAITGLTDPVAQAERFLEAGAGTVVVTCGGEGSIMMSNEMKLRAGTFPFEYVGGTGAGDAFDAGYIAGLLAGEDPQRCLEWASALGGSCVRKVSATDGVFSKQEAIEFLKTHRLQVAKL